MRTTAKHSFIDGVELHGDSDAEFDFLIPAFVDIHCHGGGGKYFSENAEIARETHYQHGTRIQLASLVTADIEVLIKQIEYLKNKEIFGIHLEGPYLSTKFCGAHDPNLLKAPEISELQKLVDAGGGAVKMVTISPELPNAIEAIKYLVSQNVIVAIGHSDASADDTQKAIAAGAKVVTHFNNAMSKIPNEGSLSEVALGSELFLELIEDGHHVSKSDSLAIIDSAPNRIIAVTDAMSAAGASDGDYKIGNLNVEVKSGVAKLTGSGALAGSTLTMLDAFFNFYELVGFEKAVAYTSLNPAKILDINPYSSYIGIKGRKVTHL